VTRSTGHEVSFELSFPARSALDGAGDLRCSASLRCRIPDRVSEDGACESATTGRCGSIEVAILAENHSAKRSSSVCYAEAVNGRDRARQRDLEDSAIVTGPASCRGPVQVPVCALNERCAVRLVAVISRTSEGVQQSEGARWTDFENRALNAERRTRCV
jgi:hypothetical protein